MRVNLLGAPFAELPAPNSPELPFVELSQQPNGLTPPDLTLRDRLRQSRVARTALILATTTGLLTTTIEGSPAHADTGLEYTVDGTDAGVYARHSPHENDTDRIPGQGANDGDRVELICGVVNGDAVGSYGNHTWHKVKDLTNGQGPFWINDHWVKTPNSANELAPGEANCDDDSQAPDLQPAIPVSPFISFDRNAAKEWALDHATDTPPDAGSCTWFVSQALAKGGFPQTTTWNLGIEGFTRDGIRHGTDATKITPTFLSYMRGLPYVQVENLGHMSSDNNDIPDAKVGDIVLYDWEDDNSVDHADVVTGTAADNPQYPLLSGWSEDGSNAVSYKQRGWTWSQQNSVYLQLEKDSQGHYIHKNMVAYLIHIKSEDELQLN